jgi:uroporphyrinogen decarboxylase
MTTRERVFAALNHQQPDKVPYDVQFTKVAHAKMVEYYGDPDFSATIGNCFVWYRPYPHQVRFHLTGPDLWVDEFGVKWDRSVDKDIGIPTNIVVTPDNIDDVPWPSADDPSRYDHIQKAIPECGDRMKLVSLGFALFERAWTLCGMENVLVYMLTEKDFVHKLFDKILDYNLGIIENACSLDIDIFRFGDDWGQQRGLIMGIDLWREFIKPRIKKMCHLAHVKGAHVMIHCCGKVEELFPELVECGVDIFNPFQPEVMDVFEMKKQYGNILSFFGGISIQRTLPFGTVAQVKEEVKKLIDIVGEKGGYIASPSHDTPADAKPENIAAMIEVLQSQ